MRTDKKFIVKKAFVQSVRVQDLTIISRQWYDLVIKHN